MKRSSLSHDFAGAVSYPLAHARPEPRWETAHQGGAIPDALFRFYCRTRYFSRGSEPTFLADPQGVLFGYLRVLTNGVRICLEEAQEGLAELAAAHSDECRSVREGNGLTWDHLAIRRQQQAFRSLLLALAGALDQGAETLALLFYGHAKNLPVGSAGVAALRKSLVAATSSIEPTLDPKVIEWRTLAGSLLPALEGSGPAAGWLEQFLLFRNKVVHYGPSALLSLGLYDDDGNVYTFLPRDWPLITEQFITPPSEPPAPPDVPSTFEQAHLEEDLVEYSTGLRLAVLKVLEAIYSSLCTSYAVLTGMPTPQGLLQDLLRAGRPTTFQHFPPQST